MSNQLSEIERARSALSSIDPGTDRKTWVKIGMATKAAGLDFDTWHDWSATAGNYRNESDCRAVWQSFKDGGIAAATLFHLARAEGWNDAAQIPPNRTESRQKERPQAEEGRSIQHDPLTLWDDYEPAPFNHPYIEKKLGLPDGLRVYSGDLRIAGQSLENALVLPVRTLDGNLVSLQFITDAGKKLFLPGAKLPPDACLTIGGPIGEKPLYICEGIGQAWSAHQATTAPAVVCFGVGRMAGIAKALRERHKAAKLVLVADAGKESQMAAIARDIQGAWVEMPAGSPSNYDLNDLHRDQGMKAVKSLLENAKTPTQRFKLLTPAELATLPPVRWRVRGVLPESGIAALYGPSGSGKSFLALDLLGAVAAGREWFGNRSNACQVLYVGLEAQAGIAQRVHAYQTKNGKVPLGFKFLLEALDIRKPGDRADLAQAARAAGCIDGILVIDTLNQATPGMDENDSSSMGEAISAAKAVQAELGGLVLLIHHTGKDQTKGLRGHSSLHAALDAAVEVTRDGDRREWRTAKSKDGEDGTAHPFRLDVVEIGEDDDGEPITSCVIVPEEDAGVAVRRVKIPAGGNQRLIWDALQPLFKAAGVFAPEGAPDKLPPGRPCLKLDDAIAKTRDRLTVESDRKTERARQAFTGLITRGLLEHEGGFVWLK